MAEKGRYVDESQKKMGNEEGGERGGKRKKFCQSRRRNGREEERTNSPRLGVAGNVDGGREGDGVEDTEEIRSRGALEAVDLKRGEGQRWKEKKR
jgi:hypothetical protein